MITRHKIEIFKKYQGDIDGMVRVGRTREIDLFDDGDWSLIDSVLQDLEIIGKGLCSTSYKDRLENLLVRKFDREGRDLLRTMISDPEHVRPHKRITLVSPELRFNKTISEHRKERINPGSKPLYPLDYDLPFEYCCCNCDYKISIKNQDFEKHCKSRHSNLKFDDRREIQEYILANRLDDLSFLDFACPKCGQPVRILFDYGPGGLYGMTYEIKHVIEMRNV